jgi:hypothetical protein
VQFNLSNSNSEPIVVQVVNNLGQTVKTFDLGNSANLNQSLDLAGLNSGIYFVKTTLGGKPLVKKLIID